MSYSTVETAALTVLKLDTANWDANNCVAGSTYPMRKGYERFLNVLYGGGTRTPLTLTIMRHKWTVCIDLYVPYRGDLQTLEAALATERQKVIDQLAKYPLLNGCAGVNSAEIMNGDRPIPLENKRSPYRGQRLYLEVQENAKPARVE
jgi:hypothetical protein